MGGLEARAETSERSEPIAAPTSLNRARRRRVGQVSAASRALHRGAIPYVAPGATGTRRRGDLEPIDPFDHLRLADALADIGSRSRAGEDGARLREELLQRLWPGVDAFADRSVRQLPSHADKSEVRSRVLSALWRCCERLDPSNPTGWGALLGIRLRGAVSDASLADDVLDAFGLEPDANLDLLRPGQSLTALLGRAVGAVGDSLSDMRPDVVMVQGDTTTAAGAALAAAQLAIPVAHVEAGLRSGDRTAPFPEEDNRRLIGAVAELHLAPTLAACTNLLRENVGRSQIVVTGNTCIDALDHILRSGPPPGDPVARRVAAHPGPVVLVTTHRRESWGTPMAGTARAIRRLVEDEQDLLVVVPVHPNPEVAGVLYAELDGLERVILCPALPYATLATVLASSTLTLTDSGGIQEEAPRLGVPVLVLRDTTERPEGVQAGASRLVGTDAERIVRVTRRVLHSPTLQRMMGRPRSIYGDGHASERVVHALSWRFSLRADPPDDFVPEATPPHRHRTQAGAEL